MSWKANTPSLVVDVAWSRPVALSVAFTCAFGTTPPDGSVTVPLIAPRNVWPFTATASDKTTRIAKTRRFIKSTPPYGDQKATPAFCLPAARLKKQNPPKTASQAVLFSCLIETCCRNPRTSTPQTSSPSSVQKNATALRPHSQVARVLTRSCASCQGLSISSTGPINFILGGRRGRVPRQV